MPADARDLHSQRRVRLPLQIDESSLKVVPKDDPRPEILNRQLMAELVRIAVRRSCRSPPGSPDRATDGRTGRRTTACVAAKGPPRGHPYRGSRCANCESSENGLGCDGLSQSKTPARAAPPGSD